MERRIPQNISENINSEQNINQREPFAHEALEGIADEGLKNFLQVTIPKFCYRDDGVVIEKDTVFAVMPIIFQFDGKSGKPSKSILSFNRKINILQRTGLYHHYLVPNPQLKKPPRYVATEDSMINAITFLYIKEREDKKRRQPSTGFEIMLKTAEAFGENPRSQRFFEIGIQLKEQYERSMKGASEKVKKIIKSKDLKDLDHRAQKQYFIWDKNFSDKKQITLHDKLSCLNIDTITEILGKVNYVSEIDEFSISRRQRNYQEFGLDREVGLVIEYIRKLASKDRDNSQATSGFDLKRFKNGLLVVRGYLQKYPNIPNCDVLLMAIKRKLNNSS